LASAQEHFLAVTLKITSVRFGKGSEVLWFDLVVLGCSHDRILESHALSEELIKLVECTPPSFFR
jgi:hypothetical protein